MKEELGNEKIGINKVWAFEEQTKGFQRSEVGIRGEGMETWVKRLICGTMPPQVKHPTLL
jgi:hypothetical protein